MARVSEDHKAENEAKCAPNRLVTLHSCVTVDGLDRYNRDTLRMDMVFSDGIRIPMTNPYDSVARKSRDAAVYSSLLSACGQDWEMFPGCFGWEDFCQKFVRLVNDYAGMQMFAKLTLNEGGWIALGEGKCFSNNPDMKYTVKDTRFLTVHEDGDGVGFNNLP